ncbi:elongation factor G [Coralliovum pocilloporae]|uniref:elongation factor G n=1 Tax=Coralliovum pocilloporae TaxID=3066369 RepID=UPI003306DAE3
MENHHGRVSGPRAIAIMGPFGSGKTTLLEAILERCGVLERMGSVDAGSSVGDGSPEARAHNMSVETNIAQATFMGDRYTFLDCPGSVEFAGEAAGISGAVDLAIVCCEADERKVPALQLILKSLEDRAIPHMLFLNKTDKVAMPVRDVLSLLQPASARPFVLRQIPIWQNDVITGFIDLALERAHVFREHAPSEVIDMSDADKVREAEARFSMLETLADYDDTLMETLLEDEEPDLATVFGDLTDEMQSGQICPVFMGSASHGNGILRLLKSLRHEAPAVESLVTRLGGEASGTSVQILKSIHTSHGGKISVARVLAGEVSDGTELLTSDGDGGRVSGIFDIQGQKATKRGVAQAGEVIGLGKLDVGGAGATLSSEKAGGVQLGTLDIPKPVLSLAVAPVERKDEVKLSSVLQKIVEEDISLSVCQVQETGETLLEGQGEMHLRVAVERLTGKYGIDVTSHAPSVPYRETIRKSISQRGKHKKQSGGHGQFGDVLLDIRPQPRGTGFEFTQNITGGAVPKQYFSAVENGVEESLKKGPLGFQVVDVAVNLSDGSYHSVDSSDQAFKMAAQLAIREGLAECSPVLLEPMVHVDISCPNSDTPKINAIVSSHRGQLLGFDGKDGWAGWDVVEAIMPENEVRNLIVEIRSATAGAGSFTTRFDHLAELTGKAADAVLAQRDSEAA